MTRSFCQYSRALPLRLAKFFLTPLVVASVVAVQMVPASAQRLPTREQLHKGTVSIISGKHDYLISRMTSDLASVLDEGDNLRVLAIAGRGAISDLLDTLLLSGIDLAVVPADVIQYVEKKRLIPKIRQLKVVSRLFNKVAHLVARSDVKSLADLRGKKINVVSNYHGAFVTAQNVFKTLDIDYTPAYFDERLGLQKVRNGEIAATLIMSGRPNPLLDELREGSSLKIVNIPFTQNFPDVYFPVELSSADYPELILPGQTVSTIGTASIMLAYNFLPKSERRIKVTRFVDAFLSRLSDLQKAPRHPRWRDVKLGVAVAGLNRYGPVTEWLKTNKAPSIAALSRPKKGKRSLEQLFKAFIASEAATGGAEQLLRLDKPELFKRFKAWQVRQRQAPTRVAAKPKGKPSLRSLFRTFIDDESNRIGKDNVLALSKSELYQRFLSWREQR